VRIGKWRWPPAKEELDEAGNEGQPPEGFFEFKMRKMQVSGLGIFLHSQPQLYLSLMLR